MIGTFTALLLMLLVSNGMPVLATRIFGSYGAVPLDLGRRWPDGRPVFGTSKSWRGVVFAVAGACLSGQLFGYGWVFGALFGLLAMAGDLVSSFIKRRMGLRPSAKCTGLDQLPEALLPSLYAAWVLGLAWWLTLLLPLAFMLLEILISRPLYKLRIRKRPY